MVWAVQGGLTPQPSQLPSEGNAPNPNVASAVQSLAVLILWFESMAIVVPLWLGAVGWGYPVRRFLLGGECGIAVQAASGLAVISLLTWLTAWAGLVNRATAWALCGAGIALLVMQAFRHWRTLTAQQIVIPWLALILAPAVGLMAAAAACPPGWLWSVEAYGYDVLSYHLQLPRQWLERGQMTGFEHNVYSYLPNLVEAVFTQLGAMRGGLHEAIHAAQVFSVTTAILSAALVGRLVQRRFGNPGGIVAAAVLISIPWTVICGTLAYSELFALSMGAAAVAVLFDTGGSTVARATLAGGLLGTATLAKLTAGPMIAVPVVAVVWMGMAAPRPDGPRFGRTVALAATMALAGALVIAPYLVRNATWTGNPVFPFATDIFGRAHWSVQQARTWSDVHAPKLPAIARVRRLVPQWLANTGYGGALGLRRQKRAAEAERFEVEGRVSLLWTAVAVALLVLCRTGDGRRFAAAMAVMLVVQVLFWMWATMQPSRYLYFSVLPGTLLVGAAVGRSRSRFTIGVAVALVLALTALSFGTFYRQVRPLRVDGCPVRQQPWQVVGRAAELEHPLNQLPPNSRTYLVADAAILYVAGSIVYNTAWDLGPLGGWVRRSGADAGAVTDQLKREGITHVWVSWSELRRIHRTIGFTDDLPEAALRRIARHWRVIDDYGPVTLYQLP